MDRLLRPKTLETESTAPNAEKLYKHWKTTFENYVKSCVPAITPGVEGDAASMETYRAAVAAADEKKLHALQNAVSHEIFELMTGCKNYDAAITILDAAYIRPTSVVHNRHQLISCKQDPAKSIDGFLQDLNRISKSCNFQAVTAEQNRSEYVRDAFIKGISSSNIRQRLLENMGDLSLDQAYTQARALEQAQTQSASYENSTVAAVVPDCEGEPLAAAGNDRRKSNNNGNNNFNNNFNNNNNNNNGHNRRRGGNRNFARNNNNSNNNNNNNNNQRNNRDNTSACWFCGNGRHNRSMCPARDDVCEGCGTKGHWLKVCNKTNSLGAMEGGSQDHRPSLC